MQGIDIAPLQSWAQHVPNSILQWDFLLRIASPFAEFGPVNQKVDNGHEEKAT
jgi:hypothetical protein